jgi:NTE family protein
MHLCAMERRPFVLSGGGARGFAHLGVLRALAEAGVRPSAISGTSAGSVMGAFIASGLTPERTMALLREEWRIHRTRWKVLRGEFLTQRRIGEFLRDTLPCERFEDLEIPLFVSATDVERGGQRIFSSGPLIPALLAASAVPMVFPPVVIEGTAYVDGGLSNNLPIEPFNDRRGEVVAIYVNPLRVFDPKASFRTTLDRTFHLSFREMVMRSAQGCHLFVEPSALSRYGMFDLRHTDRIEQVGYEHTRNLLRARS